jgi:hypothetical protein
MDTPTFSNSVVVHLPAYEDGTDRVFQNIGIQNSDAGELPRRKHTNIFLSCTHEIIFQKNVPACPLTLQNI